MLLLHWSAFFSEFCRTTRLKNGRRSTRHQSPSSSIPSSCARTCSIPAHQVCRITVTIHTLAGLTDRPVRMQLLLWVEGGERERGVYIQIHTLERERSIYTNTRDRAVYIYKYTRSKVGQAVRRRGKERSSSELLSCKSRRKAQVDVSRTSSVICAALIFDSAATQQFVKLAAVSHCFSVSLSVFRSR